MSNSDSVALLVIAFFGMLAFFAWLLILLLIGGGLWWYKSSSIAFTQCIDISLLFRQFTPSIFSERVMTCPFVEKEKKFGGSNVEKSDCNLLQSEIFNKETLDLLKSLEVDFSNAEQNESSEKDLKQIGVQTNKMCNALETSAILKEPKNDDMSFFTSKYLCELQKTLILQIKKIIDDESLEGWIDHSHPHFIPEEILRNLKEYSGFQYKIENQKEEKENSKSYRNRLLITKLLKESINSEEIGNGVSAVLINEMKKLKNQKCTI